VSVTAPLGFRAAGAVAGLKASGDRDVAVVINDGPSRAAAATFTSNRVKAAPVLWTRQVVEGQRVRAVALNSGGANACTGPLGFQDTHLAAERLADALGDSAGEMAVCSTGLIGERLAMDKILPAIDACVADASRGGGLAAADAIRTTDTVVKISFRRAAAGPGPGANPGPGPGPGASPGPGPGASPGPGPGASPSAGTEATGYAVGGMAKGAGMLAPALATMLCVLTTDADLDAGDLDAALRTAVRVSFDRLDTDGCMSTNDTVLLMASGASGIRPDPREFTSLLTEVCTDLARQLQLDAEGAGKMIAVEVIGAASEADAVTAGRAVARSNLLKCAIAGADPNWGRVVSAVGTTSAQFEPDRLNVAINGIWVCRNGCAGDERSKVDMSARDVTITVDLSAGPNAATILTTDLTAEYVHENSAYPT
jgi:glutamate N-acetyltransferase/amino-acid N-acetyltransferase